MDKISLIIIDTRKYTLNELLSKSSISDEELKEINTYKNIDVRKEKVASLILKEKYIGEYKIDPLGKPISNNCYFNFSHSKGVVVLAINKKYEIGVDVEVLRKIDDDLAKYISSEEEYKSINNEIDFYSIWTNKESLTKCYGTAKDSNVKSIPSLPLNGPKIYKELNFFTKIIKRQDYIISISIKSKEDFEVEIIQL